MGKGGKQSAKNTTNDNDIMAADNAVVVGANGGYQNIEDNEGLIVGEGAEINTGVQVGIGGSYSVTTMDDNTAGLLDNAMTLMYANTENVLENYAAQIGVIDSPEFMNPEISSAVQLKTPAGPMSTGSKVILSGTGLLLLAALAMNGRKKNV